MATQGKQAKGARKLGRNFRTESGSIGSVTHYVASGGPGRHLRKVVAHHGTILTHAEGSDRVIRVHQGYDPGTKKGCSLSNPCPIHEKMREERVRYQSA